MDTYLQPVDVTFKLVKRNLLWRLNQLKQNYQLRLTGLFYTITLWLDALGLRCSEGCPLEASWWRSNMWTEKPPFLFELITNFCIPFILPLALQTRQFTKRQLRSQEVNANGVFSKASMPIIKPQSAWNTACWLHLQIRDNSHTF